MKMCISKPAFFKTIATAAMISLPVISPVAVQASSIQWQPTHKMNYNFTGNCQLQSNKISVTIHPFFAEVEEEAIIKTAGTVFTGDSATLEIFGAFKITDDAVIRSMLLWNGDKLLKAKLYDKKVADSLYEDVVDRDKVTYVPRDPALIYRLDDGQYEFKIYPVAINKERRIRILYSIPVTPSAEGVRFTLNPAFSTGARTNPTTIPVKVTADSSLGENCIITYGSTNKPLIYGATYNVPQTEFQEGMYYDANWNWISRTESIDITVPHQSTNSATSAVIASGKAAGFYTGIMLSAPKELKEIVERDIVQTYAVQTIIDLGTDKMVTDNVSLESPIGLYIKTESPWLGKVQWNIYNPKSGKSLYIHNQTVATTLDTAKISSIPLLWATKYAQSTKTQNLGGLYGFVDQRMALLALEKDSLKESDAKLYETTGVPLLNSSEIFVDAKNLAKLPSNYAVIEATPIKNELALKALKINLTVINGNELQLAIDNLNAETISVAIYNLKGQLIQNSQNIRLANGLASIPLNSVASGAYIVKINGANMNTQTAKFMIP